MIVSGSHFVALRMGKLAFDDARLKTVFIKNGAGGATEADLIEQLLGEHAARSGYFSKYDFSDLLEVSARKPRANKDYEFPLPLVERCRKRILEVELTRGDNPTAASAPRFVTICGPFARQASRNSLKRAFASCTGHAFMAPPKD